MSPAHPQTGGTNREEQVSAAAPELIPRQYTMLSRGAEIVWALGRGVPPRRNEGEQVLLCCFGFRGEKPLQKPQEQYGCFII